VASHTGILDKNPETRMTLEQIMVHDWVTGSGTMPLSVSNAVVGAGLVMPPTKVVRFKKFYLITDLHVPFLVLGTVSWATSSSLGFISSTVVFDLCPVHC